MEVTCSSLLTYLGSLETHRNLLSSVVKRLSGKAIPESYFCPDKNRFGCELQSSYNQIKMREKDHNISNGCLEAALRNRVILDFTVFILTVYLMSLIHKALDAKWDQDLMLLLTTTPHLTDTATAVQIVPSQTPGPYHATATMAPTPTQESYLVDPPGWDCGIVNNPDTDGYKPNLQDAPTASHVLALPGVGETGVDDPPYLLIRKDSPPVKALSQAELHLVINGDKICAGE